MLPQTENAIKNLAALDASITPDRVAAALRVMRGDDEPQGVDAVEAIKIAADELLTRKQVSQLLGVTPKSVSNYAKRGRIKQVGGGALRTQARYSRKSVEAYLRGEVAA